MFPNVACCSSGPQQKTAFFFFLCVWLMSSFFSFVTRQLCGRVHMALRLAPYSLAVRRNTVITKRLSANACLDGACKAYSPPQLPPATVTHIFLVSTPVRCACLCVWSHKVPAKPKKGVETDGQDLRQTHQPAVEQIANTVSKRCPTSQPRKKAT